MTPNPQAEIESYYTTVVVSIGRNRGDQPMHDTEWAIFRSLVSDDVVHHAGQVFFAGEGRGYGEWGTEDAFTLVGGATDRGARANLEHDLGLLAKSFGQEAIAVTYGNAQFVGPAT